VLYNKICTSLFCTLSRLKHAFDRIASLLPVPLGGWELQDLGKYAGVFNVHLLFQGLLYASSSYPGSGSLKAIKFTSETAVYLRRVHFIEIHLQLEHPFLSKDLKSAVSVKICQDNLG
jgi:hypothetical protein